MKSNITKILFIILCTVSIVHGQSPKEKLTELMEDNNVNFYDVVNFAEKNYSSELRKTKGTGWKPFLRWKNENEYKFYPSGDRSQINFDAIYDNYLDVKKSSTQNQKTVFNNGWEELGPTEPGQITGHYSFGMGRIVSFYINATNTNQMYIGTRTGGFWKTTNGGTSWTGGGTDFLPASGVNTIAVNPTGTNAGKILININNSSNHYTHGIYQSTDGGDSFTQSVFNPINLGWGGLGSNREIYKIKYHPTIANLVFIGTRVGLFRSTNDLTTTGWTVPVSSDDFTDIDFHPTDANIMYAYAKNKPNVIYVSTDTGVTFNTVSIPGSSGSKGTIQVSDDCPDCVYYMSEDGYWKSTNKGVSFTQISTPGVDDAGFAVSDVDDNNILAGYLDAQFSTDGGTNFNQVTYWSLGNTNGNHASHQESYNTSSDYIHADIQAAECINGTFYAVTDGFLVSSGNNGQDWNIIGEKGIGIRMNYNLGVSQSNHYRTICGSQDNGISIKTENGWVEMYGADGMEGIIHPLNDDWMIGSTQNGGRVLTKNIGQDYSSITPNGGNDSWVAPMFYDPNNHMTVYHLGENVMKSTNFGDTFTTLGSPSFTGNIKYAAIAENNSNIIAVSRYENIELSEDGGNTFSNIKGSLPNNDISDITFDPTDDDTIIVTYATYWDNGNKIFISHDRGATWSNITYNLNNMPIYSVIIDHSDDSNIYLGAEIGVYKKKMNENTWSLYNTDLPNVSVKEMEVVNGSNTLRATTWGRGLWEFAIDKRKDYPAIVKTSIPSKPTLSSPKQTIDQYVTSEILYDNTLTNVYVKWSVGSPIFDNTIQMSNTSGNVWKSDTPIPDQAIGTKVFFKVFAEGSSSDITETYKFMYTVHEFKYCEANGSDADGNLYISNVTLQNINKTSTNDHYTYNTGDIINLEAGSTYTLSLTSNTNWSENDYGTWIDFNKNGVFENSELILSSINASSNTASTSFTVPLEAELTQNVRMRVRLGYWDSPVLDPCGETLGEVEDYPVNISASVLNTESIKHNEFKVFPNPTTGKVTLEFTKTYADINIQVVNVLGQQLLDQRYFNVKSIDFNIDATQGIYFVKMINNDNDSEFITKIIKQ